jgi:tight adherence protein B
VEVLVALFLLIFFVTVAAIISALARRSDRERDDALLRRLGYIGPPPGQQKGVELRRPTTPPTKAHTAVRKLEVWLATAGLRIPPWLFVAITLALFGGGFVPAVASFDPLTSAACGLGLAALPMAFVRLKYSRRLRLLAEQLPYVLDLLKSALESGHTLIRGLQMAVKNLPVPISGEVQLLVDRVQVGMTLAQALESMYERVPIEELGLLMAALKIQAQVGSSLAEILQHVSEGVRNRQRVEQQVRTLTAQARASAAIVTVLPFVILGVFMLVRPGYADPLFYNPLGVRLLKLAILLDVGAFLAMRRIAQVDY